VAPRPDSGYLSRQSFTMNGGGAEIVGKEVVGLDWHLCS